MNKPATKFMVNEVDKGDMNFTLRFVLKEGATRVRILFEDCNKRQVRICCKKAEHVKLQWGYHPPLLRDKPVALIVLQKPCHRKGAMEHNS